MGLPTGNVQAAVITLLQGDSVLQNLLGNPVALPFNIYDAGAVPTNTPFPYLAVSPITTQKGTLLVMGLDAADVYLQVSGFTKYGGFSQARGIMAQVYLDLDQVSLTIIGVPLGTGTHPFTNPFTLFDDAIEHESGEEGVQQIDHRYKLMVQG